MTIHFHWRTSIWSSMVVFDFLQSYLWSEKQNHFVNFMIIFSVKSTILSSLIIELSLLQIAAAITSGSLIQPEDPRFSQFFFTQFDCSKQYKLIQFSWIRVQNSNQASSEIEDIITFDFLSIRVKAKKSFSKLCNYSKHSCALCSRCTWQIFQTWS